MTEEKNKSKVALGGAIVAAVAASLCCILPLIAAVAGFTGFAASQFFERWRPYLLAATFGLLAVGFYFAYRPREACEAGSVCERTPAGRWNRAVLWLVAVLVVVLAGFPYYSGWVARAMTKTHGPAEVLAQSSQAHAVLNIDGMSCGSCAALLEKNLSQIPGVRRAQVSFEKKQAILDYDPRKVDPLRFVKSVADAGFKVAGSPTATN